MSGDSASKSGFSTQDIAGFATVSLIWGSTWLVIRDQIGFLPIGWTVTIRFTVAALGMFLLARFRGEDLSLNRQRFLLALAVGLLQFCGNFQLVYRAEHYVTSGLVAVMYALLMLPNAILARIFLGARITGRFMAGTFVAALGIALLMIQEYRHAPPSGAMDVALGVGFAIAGTLCASGANVLQASSIGRQQAVVPMIAWSMLLGAVIDAVMAFGLYGAPVLPTSPRFWGGVGWLAVMGSVVTFPVYFSLIRSIGPGRAAYSNAVVPIVAMALSTLFEGYHWTMLAVVGAVVTLSGVLIALSGRKG